jgi:hypothetical protein
MAIRPFFKARFRVRPEREAVGKHWSGGPAYHKGAECPVCEKPLMLLWDLSADDIESRTGDARFAATKRLPLYFCWGCVGDLYYRVISEKEIHVVENRDGRKGGGAEYEDYPEFFPRRAIELVEGVPQEVKAVISKWRPEKDSFGRRLSAADKAVLGGFFGHPVAWSLELFFHQLGGEPLAKLWNEPLFCPNAGCSSGLVNRLLRKKGRPMKFLAGVLNDPPAGLPMIEPLTEETTKHWNHFVSVQFHVCDKCLIICGCNRSD